MCIALRNYRTFEGVNSLIQFGVDTLDKRAADVLALAKKVGTLALAVLAFLPILLIDLILTPMALAARYYYPIWPAPMPAPAFIAQPPAGVEPIVGRPAARKVPTHDQMIRLHDNPYPDFPFERSNIDFFKDSLASAFTFLSQEKVNQYKELIENGGAAEVDEAPIDIFQWTTSCLIAHYLRTRSRFFFLTEQTFPKVLPEPDEPLVGRAREEWLERLQKNRDEMERIWDLYIIMSLEDQSAVLLTLIAPEENWRLSERAEILVQAAQAKAQTITQDQHFNTRIYPPATQNIDNI